MFLIQDQMIAVISIHALREEGDSGVALHQYLVVLFLSTPSARRATRLLGQRFRLKLFLSTPSARRATQGH